MGLVKEECPGIMKITTTQKRAIDHYYKKYAVYHTHKMTHETAVRSVFQFLFSTIAQSANWNDYS